MSNEAAAVVPDGANSITNAVRNRFDEAQVRAIKATAAKDCNDAELVMFLEVCARYDLDPFAKQVFAAKMGGGGISIVVSRDGLLAHAHKQPDFVRLDGDVVCQKDEFRMTFADGQRQIEHSYGDPTARGTIIGAWAMVERLHKGQTYFYAPMSEYKGKSPIWSKYPTAMILKVAESYALRKAFSISGVVSQEEIDQPSAPAPARPTAPASEPEPDYGDDPEVEASLRDAIGQAQTVWPMEWRDTKVKALLTNSTAEGRQQLLDELNEKLLAETKRAASEQTSTSDEMAK